MANNLELNLPATAWVPVTATLQRGVVQNRPYLSFDDTTVERADSQPFAMPAAYTGSGTLKVDLYYIMASAITGKVDWELSVEAVTPLDTFDIDAGGGFDTPNAANKTVPGTAGYLDFVTITLTNKDSVAAGDMVRLSLERDANDATDDTATGDARFLFARVYEEA